MSLSDFYWQHLPPTRKTRARTDGPIAICINNYIRRLHVRIWKYATTTWNHKYIRSTAYYLCKTWCTEPLLIGSSIGAIEKTINILRISLFFSFNKYLYYCYILLLRERNRKRKKEKEGEKKRRRNKTFLSCSVGLIGQNYLWNHHRKYKQMHGCMMHDTYYSLRENIVTVTHW